MRRTTQQAVMLACVWALAGCPSSVGDTPGDGATPHNTTHAGDQGHTTAEDAPADLTTSQDMGGAGAHDMPADASMTLVDMGGSGAQDMGGSQDMGASSAPTCKGYATRYWDCCKAHCGWAGNVPAGVSPVTSCDASGTPHASFDVVSACANTSASAAFTCASMAPWEVSPTLSYGFAAVPATGDICGRCYELTFDGASFNAGNDAGAAALAGKRMIVQATNIGHDVGNGQFDLLIPGGGVGIFDACTFQWSSANLGAQYGGFLSECKSSLGAGASHAALKSCLTTKCDATFGSSFADLKAGCRWFAGWFEVADNPSLQYREVACPDAIVTASGVDRRPLQDVRACNGGGGSDERCPQQVKDQCDCSWANGGASCGTDDGSCCWSACCDS